MAGKSVHLCSLFGLKGDFDIGVAAGLKTTLQDILQNEGYHKQNNTKYLGYPRKPKQCA